MVSITVRLGALTVAFPNIRQRRQYVKFIPDTLFSYYEVDTWLTNLGRPLLGFSYLSFPLNLLRHPATTTILNDLIAKIKDYIDFSKINIEDISTPNPSAKDLIVQIVGLITPRSILVI